MFSCSDSHRCQFNSLKEVVRFSSNQTGQKKLQSVKEKQVKGFG